MGARTYWEIRGYEGSPSTYLYNHWGGESKWEDTKKALEASQPRWGDVSYASRIFISQIIGENWASETGYGIVADERGAMPFEEEYFAMTVDFGLNQIEISGMVMSFSEFLASADKTEELMEAIWA